MIYRFSAGATISCYTEVEADTLEEAQEIAKYRELASLCHKPCCGEVTEDWHFDNDGCPVDIKYVE